MVLWAKSFTTDPKLDLLNLFIKTILLEDKAPKAFTYADYVLKFKVQNDLHLVFAIIYKEILQLAFVEELLDMIRYEFVTKVYPALQRQGEVYLDLPTVFDQHFQVLWKRWEQKARELEGPK